MGGSPQQLPDHAKLRTLFALGWTARQVAEEYGVTPQRVRDVRAKNHLAVGAPRRLTVHDIPADVDPKWRERAACAGLDPHLFEGEDGKRICQTCPVAADCLASALAEEAGQSHMGRACVRGGLYPEERVKMEKQRTAERDAARLNQAAS